MARSGSFGGSLNPFGGGSLTGFGQYEIGSNLAELEVYKITVAWGNGTATDEEYLAALQKAVDATDPETRERESAVNRIEDARYQIGRSKASEQGLDALIAFDQAAIAKMNPDNTRYRNVKDALDNELASRRSRDYGKLVQEYNDGKLSTEKLVEWVTSAIKGIDPDDPDYEQWLGTQRDLAERVKSEKDQEVYQDYQQGRMDGKAFLAYLTGRRDGYDPSSPQFDDWANRLEDAQKQVKQAELAKQDTKFFNAYEEGHRSDNQYLKYLRTRIADMDPDDPDLPTWRHRLNQAAFSIAEDKLRFAVQTGKEPVGRLITFYKNYQRTLNPGSSEYRTIARALLSLHGGSGGGGGGGGGGSRSASGTGGDATAGKGKLAITKQISGKYTLDNIMPLLRVNVTSKHAATQKSALDLNLTRIQNAQQRGDDLWLFVDPNKPRSMIPGRFPDGSPMVGADGKPIMVPGTKYLPVTSQAVSNLLSLKSDSYYQTAALALANHDTKGYYYNLKLAANADDAVRLNDAQYIDRSNKRFYERAEDGIEAALKVGDYATAVNLSIDVQRRIDAELRNPMIDDTRRDALNGISEKLAKNALLPQVDPVTRQRTGGAIDLANSSYDARGNLTRVALNPGWHQVLDKTDDKGGAAWGLQYDDRQDGTWEQTHLTVQTLYGSQVVTGEVSIRSAPVNPTMAVRTPNGEIRTDSDAMFVHFTDENGQVVKAYSLDGQTWIRSLTGVPPVLEFNADLTQTTDDKGTHLVDGDGNIVFTQSADGSWAKNRAYFKSGNAPISWFGQESFPTGKSMSAGEYFGSKGVGAPGQFMQVTQVSPSGSINLTGVNKIPRDNIAADARDAKEAASTRRATGRLPWEPGPDRSAHGELAQSVYDAKQIASRVRAGLAPLPPKADPAAQFVNTVRSQLPADTPMALVGRAIASKPAPLPPIKSLAPIIDSTPATIKPPAPKRTAVKSAIGIKARTPAPKPPAPKPRRRNTTTTKTGTGQTVVNTGLGGKAIL